MSKCSVVKCPVYTSEGEGMDLGNGVFAWVPLCTKHKAVGASNLSGGSANTQLKRKLAKPKVIDREGL